MRPIPLLLENLKPGTRVSCDGYSATVVFNKPRHSVSPFIGCALIQHDGDRGWEATIRSDLAPKGEYHLMGLNRLYWARPEQLSILELELDFEVDG